MAETTVIAIDGKNALRVTYEGMSFPGGSTSRYEYDYRCPACASVELSVGNDPVTYFDGGPSTRDHLSTWQCCQCGQEGRGDSFLVSQERLNYVLLDRGDKARWKDRTRGK